jgi:hypothetical protein
MITRTSSPTKQKEKERKRKKNLAFTIVNFQFGTLTKSKALYIFKQNKIEGCRKSF